MNYGPAAPQGPNGFGDVFGTDRGNERLMELLMDPKVSQITADGWDRIRFSDATGAKQVTNVFQGPAQYIQWVNRLMAMTDVGFTDVTVADTSTIEGSFRPEAKVHGAIHICTREITHGDPVVTIRKQPVELITLDTMLTQGMLSPAMRTFLELSMRGRSNILISGGSGAGKTTLTRALSRFVDPEQRVISCEEIQELRLSDRLPNAVELFTTRRRDEHGVTLRETSLDDLVREALRMRGDRVWVGETRGKEAYALIKAANSGHDGSVTTMHADNGAQAVKQMVTYVMESGLAEQPAREQVASAFNLVVQISKVSMGRRVISEISELEPVLEGSVQRISPLFRFDSKAGAFVTTGARPSGRLLELWQRNGVNFDGVPGRN